MTLEISKELLDILVAEALLWSREACGLEAHSQKSFLEQGSLRFGGFAAMFRCSGSFEGRILLHFYLDAALKVVASLSKAECVIREGEPPVFDERMFGYLKTFATTYATRLTAALSRQEMNLSLTAPVFLETPRDFGEQATASAIRTVPLILCQAGKFYLHFLAD